MSRWSAWMAMPDCVPPTPAEVAEFVAFAKAAAARKHPSAVSVKGDLGGSDVVLGLLTVELATHVVGDAHPLEGRQNDDEQQE